MLIVPTMYTSPKLWGIEIVNYNIEIWRYLTLKTEQNIKSFTNDFNSKIEIISEHDYDVNYPNHFYSSIEEFEMFNSTMVDLHQTFVGNYQHVSRKSILILILSEIEIELGSLFKLLNYLNSSNVEQPSSGREIIKNLITKLSDFKKISVNFDSIQNLKNQLYEYIKIRNLLVHNNGKLRKNSPVHIWKNIKGFDYKGINDLNGNTITEGADILLTAEFLPNFIDLYYNIILHLNNQLPTKHPDSNFGS